MDGPDNSVISGLAQSPSPSDSKAAASARPPRFDWIDNAKAVLMLLVVFGHFHYIDAPVAGKDLIYAVHVPGFLLITGFLLPSDFGRTGLRNMGQRWIAIYVRAYVFFSAGAIALWWVIAMAKAKAFVSPLPALYGALYGVAGPDNWLVHADQPLWYLPFLITSVFSAWLAARLGDRLGMIAGWLALLVYAAVAMLYHGPRLPWDIDIAGMGAMMVFVGHRLRQHFAKVQFLTERPASALATALVLGGITVGASMINGSVNINGAEFGYSGALFLFTAICGSLTVLLLCSQIPASRLARSISINTLTIFALHIYLIRIVARLPHLPGAVGQQLSMQILAALVLLACLPLSWALKPMLDRLVNHRRPHEPVELSPPPIASGAVS